MNVTNQFNCLLSTSNNGISPEISTNKCDLPLLPRRDSSSLKTHRRRHQNDPIDPQKPYQPLLNSSTLDDLFRALTLECEQYLAATTSYQNKTYGQIIVQPSSNKPTAVESNDDDYENLHPRTNVCSPLKTSIEVISPIKRHVVSITISSKISSSIAKVTSIIPSTICHSSEEDSINISSSSTNRKRRRRARKQIMSSISTRSSSSSNERKDISLEKKPIISKRSFSTDHRQNHFPKQQTRRPRRRDVSLQHFHENSSSPLSVLLTSTKIPSDFLDHSHARQPRRSRIETIDRIHRQLSTRNNKTNNIPTQRLSSYLVY